MRQRCLDAVLAVMSLVALGTPAHAVSPDFVLSAARYAPGGIGHVDQFDASGSLIREIPINGLPYSLTTDRFGNLYVLLADFVYGEYSVNKYDSAGQVVDTIIGPSDNLLGLSIDAMDRLYVGDNGVTDRVFRYTLDGAPLGVFATVSTGLPGAPFALEFDSANRLYVSDGDVVERFNSTGASLGAFAIPAADYGFINEIAIDSFDNVYVYAQLRGNLLYVFNSAGALIDSQQRPSTADGNFAFDVNDVIYQTSVAGLSAYIDRYTADGMLLGRFTANRPGEYFDIVVYQPIPEPAAVSLAAVAAIAAVRWLRPKNPPLTR